MHNNHHDFLSLVRAYVHNERPDISSDFDIAEIMNLANQQSVLGIIAYVLSSYPDLLSEGHDKLMEQTWKDQEKYYLRRISKTNHLIHMMNVNHIPHIMIKGYVVRNYYPNPGLRSFSDIDLVIKKEDRNIMHAYMEKMGYECETNWEPVYSYKKGKSEYYEIHTEIIDRDDSENNRYSVFLKQQWEYTNKISENSYELKPEFHLIYMLIHIAKHLNSGGAGIRMYLDIALFVKKHRSSLDWEWIRYELLKLRLRQFSDFVFTIIKKWFDVDPPWNLISFNQNVLDDFANYTFSGTVFNYANVTSGMKWIQSEQISNRKDINKRKALISRLCPSAKSIESRYTYLQKREWLLPVAWVHRLIITRKDIKSHIKQAHEIVVADRNEMNRLRNLRRTIGL